MIKKIADLLSFLPGAGNCGKCWGVVRGMNNSVWSYIYWEHSFERLPPDFLYSEESCLRERRLE